MTGRSTEKDSTESSESRVTVSIEVTTLIDAAMVVDKSDPNWVEKACREAEREAWRLTQGNVISARAEVTGDD